LLTSATSTSCQELQENGDELSVFKVEDLMILDLSTLVTSDKARTDVRAVEVWDFGMFGGIG